MLYLVGNILKNSKRGIGDKCKGNDTVRWDKYISFALRNKRINHKSIIHRSGNSNQSHGIADDEYVTRNCSHRYSARSDGKGDIFTFKNLQCAIIPF